MGVYAHSPQRAYKCQHDAPFRPASIFRKGDRFSAWPVHIAATFELQYPPEAMDRHGARTDQLIIDPQQCDLIGLHVKTTKFAQLPLGTAVITAA